MRMNQQRLWPRGVRGGKGRTDLTGLSRNEVLHLQTQARAFTLDFAVSLGREDGDSLELRQRFPEQLKSLARQLASQVTEAGHVGAWMREAGDQAVFFRIRDRYEHHRSGCGRLFESPGKLVGADHDDVDVLPDQVSRRAQHPLVLAHCAARDEDVIVSLDVPEFAKPFLQREQRGWTGIAAALGRETRHEQTDTPELHCRLSMYGQQQMEAERQSDREPDPPHEHLGRDGWPESSRAELLAVWAV